jgi:hypothetical protein
MAKSATPLMKQDLVMLVFYVRSRPAPRIDNKQIWRALPPGDLKMEELYRLKNVRL